MIVEPAILHATTIDASLGGVLLANMLEGWLDGDPTVLTTVETADELKDCGTSPKQTGLHLSTSIDAGVCIYCEQQSHEPERFGQTQHCPQLDRSTPQEVIQKASKPLRSLS